MLVAPEDREKNREKLRQKRANNGRNGDNQLAVEAILQTACTGLFESYDATLSHSDKASPESSLAACGIMGFTGNDVRGTITLALDGQTLEHVTPGTGSPIEWLGEFMNQLLGRFKNRLLRRGIVVHVAMPMVMDCEDCRPPAEGKTNSLAFKSSSGDVFAWIEVRFGAGVVVPSEDIELAEAVAEEGDTLMF